MVSASEQRDASGGERAIGLDLGASLAKLAIRHDSGERELRLLASHDGKAVLEAVHEIAPARVGLTGAGAQNLAGRLPAKPLMVNEFAAWGRGASVLLDDHTAPKDERFLLVSLGTGTSVMLCDGMSVSRIGGTALGGGTVLGLGSLLVGEGSFERLTELAAKGDRRQVDLLVGDIYQPGQIALTGDTTAASFGKPRVRKETPGPEDLAQAIMGLVGENVAVLCSALAGTHQVERVVFGGATLRENPALRAILLGTTAAFGRQPVPLEDGEFTGALGALALVRETAA
ncbi:MAG: hypothetical protein GY723_16930 [bacterium]|nr:hypothetical protein [bacterium]MCP5069327.1 hypothetical protein [bacterium]